LLQSFLSLPWSPDGELPARVRDLGRKAEKRGGKEKPEREESYLRPAL
jgi:hypothetical protein